MEPLKCKVSAYLSKEELKKFELQQKAYGDVTQSSYIRVMLGFDLPKRGAPKGKRKKKAQKAGATRAGAVTEKKGRKKVVEAIAPRLPFPD